MKIKDLDSKGMSELRTLAKEAGITARRDWGKEDFIKALSGKTGRLPKAIKPVKKTRPPKTPDVKKTSSAKRNTVSDSVKKTAPKKTLSKHLSTAVRLRKSLKTAPLTPAESAATVSGRGPVVKTSGKHSIPDEIKQWKPRVVSTVKKLVVPEDKSAVDARAAGYGKERIVAMAVTPEKLYTYWEIPTKAVSTRRGSFNIRVTNVDSGESFFMPVSGRIDEVFINVQPDGCYKVEIGLINKKGEFELIVQSPEVFTARVQPSSVRTRKGGVDVRDAAYAGIPEAVEEFPAEFFQTGETASSY
jgi:hypothetical protein